MEILEGLQLLDQTPGLPGRMRQLAQGKGGQHSWCQGKDKTRAHWEALVALAGLRPDLNIHHLSLMTACVKQSMHIKLFLLRTSEVLTILGLHP